MAAKFQSKGRYVAAGSSFALFQYLGTAPTASASFGAAVGATGGVLVAVAMELAAGSYASFVIGAFKGTAEGAGAVFKRAQENIAKTYIGSMPVAEEVVKRLNLALKQSQKNKNPLAETAMQATFVGTNANVPTVEELPSDQVMKDIPKSAGDALTMARGDVPVEEGSTINSAIKDTDTLLGMIRPVLAATLRNASNIFVKVMPGVKAVARKVIAAILEVAIIFTQTMTKLLQRTQLAFLVEDVYMH